MPHQQQRAQVRQQPAPPAQLQQPGRRPQQRRARSGVQLRHDLTHKRHKVLLARGRALRLAGRRADHAQQRRGAFADVHHLPRAPASLSRRAPASLSRSEWQGAQHGGSRCTLVHGPARATCGRRAKPRGGGTAARLLDHADERALRQLQHCPPDQQLRVVERLAGDALARLLREAAPRRAACGAGAQSAGALGLAAALHGRRPQVVRLTWPPDASLRVCTPTQRDRLEPAHEYGEHSKRFGAGPGPPGMSLYSSKRSARVFQQAHLSNTCGRAADGAASKRCRMSWAFGDAVCCLHGCSQWGRTLDETRNPAKILLFRTLCSLCKASQHSQGRPA